MNRICLLFGAIAISLGTSYAQGVTIGSPNPPDPSAVLDVQSTQSGLLIPRMTDVQRNAIANPAEGLQVYNITSHCLEIYYPSIGWKQVSCDCNTAPVQPGQINGVATFCPGQQGITYSVLPVVGATSYTWVLPPGASIMQGAGTHSITVNMGTQSGSVSVTADNPCGVSSPQILSVNVSAVNANFSSNPASPALNSNATFTPSFTQGGTTYQWTFASGSPSASNAQNPVVVWSQPGTYSVTLIATDINGCSDTVTQNITVLNCMTGGSTTLQYTGAVQTWTVPPGICSVTFELYAASGGGTSTGGTGQSGRGGYSKGTLAVSQGEVFYIYVGQQGGIANTGSSTPTYSAFNGGGYGNQNGYSGPGNAAGGGGATDIRFGGQALSDRIIIAGGGGGGHVAYDNNRRGGPGGGLTGGSGGSNNGITAGGTGGTQTAGGVGGQYNGQSGSLGQGGHGVGDPAGGGPCCAGGGGGGYYGGAGGNHSGAGGGSSYISGHAGCQPLNHTSGKFFTNTQMTQGVQHGNGYVVISW